jgi:hypothetical protein
MEVNSTKVERPVTSLEPLLLDEYAFLRNRCRRVSIVYSVTVSCISQVDCEHSLNTELSNVHGVLGGDGLRGEHPPQGKCNGWQ